MAAQVLLRRLVPGGSKPGAGSNCASGNAGGA